MRLNVGAARFAFIAGLENAERIYFMPGRDKSAAPLWSVIFWDYNDVRSKTGF